MLMWWTAPVVTRGGTDIILKKNILVRAATSLIVFILTFQIYIFKHFETIRHKR